MDRQWTLNGVTSSVPTAAARVAECNCWGMEDTPPHPLGSDRVTPQADLINGEEGSELMSLQQAGHWLLLPASMLYVHV